MFELLCKNIKKKHLFQVDKSFRLQQPNLSLHTCSSKVGHVTLQPWSTQRSELDRYQVAWYQNRAEVQTVAGDDKPASLSWQHVTQSVYRPREVWQRCKSADRSSLASVPVTVIWSRGLHITTTQHCHLPFRHATPHAFTIYVLVDRMSSWYNSIQSKGELYDDDNDDLRCNTKIHISIMYILGNYWHSHL